MCRRAACWAKLWLFLYFLDLLDVLLLCVLFLCSSCLCRTYTVEWEGTPPDSKVEIDLYYCGDNCDDPVSTRSRIDATGVPGTWHAASSSVAFGFAVVGVFQRFRQGGRSNDINKKLQ